MNPMTPAASREWITWPLEISPSLAFYTSMKGAAGDGFIQLNHMGSSLIRFLWSQGAV